MQITTQEIELIIPLHNRKMKTYSLYKLDIIGIKFQTYVNFNRFNYLRNGLLLYYNIFNLYKRFYNCVLDKINVLMISYKVYFS